jgi:CheY-like chemotaxis protein
VGLVLVVDDEEDVRLLARVVLMRAGHEVDECPDGVSALARLARDPKPDAVVMDIRMSGLTGWEVIDRLPDGSPPVLVVTADVSAFDRAHPLLLAKPYRPEELVAAVNAALSRSTSP